MECDRLDVELVGYSANAPGVFLIVEMKWPGERVTIESAAGWIVCMRKGSSGHARIAAVRWRPRHAGCPGCFPSSTSRNEICTAADHVANARRTASGAQSSPATSVVPAAKRVGQGLSLFHVHVVENATTDSGVDIRKSAPGPHHHLLGSFIEYSAQRKPVHRLVSHKGG